MLVPGPENATSYSDIGAAYPDSLLVIVWHAHGQFEALLGHLHHFRHFLASLFQFDKVRVGFLMIRDAIAEGPDGHDPFEHEIGTLVHNVLDKIQGGCAGLHPTFIVFARGVHLQRDEQRKCQWDDDYCS